ncbi:hypothetical protein DEI92_01585 [Curtobacterium sp. MCBD17_034]|uniref:hypothetical protein n=1 Tax=unclassified Curtobacterium TaxID=257496 RepID=UPI000DAA7617|nr:MULTISPECIES: hypothetical protein [unclassified Curtobacterium]PZF62219.1 hypothetical protein DEI92_01585 [Curtobacterium sp. MCBD17_034]PZM33032.1 hypothetical protein DEI90_15110 [Curtobacterium sp. MCBD17_031]
MSNDDRDAPRWGERLPQPDADRHGEAPRDGQPRYGEQPDGQPRYGERQDPAPQDGQPRYGQQHDGQEYGQPRYGEQHDGQQYGQQHDGQQYGQQHDGQQYGRQHDGQQYGQPQYGQPHQGDTQHGAPQWQPYAQHPYGQPSGGSAAWASAGGARPSRRLGVIALIAGIVALALGIVGGIVFGQGLAHIPGLADQIRSGGGVVDQSELQAKIRQDPSVLAGIATGGLLALVGTAFGIWALVQGIIAIAKDRGRVFGIIAVVVAVLGPIAFGAVYTAVVAAATR